MTIQPSVLAAVALAMTLPISVHAQSDDHAHCSNATLRGDYAFVISGQTFSANGTTLRTGVARTHFDGAGRLTQADFVIATPPDGISAPIPAPPADIDPTTGFHTNEGGPYTVNADCTGNAVITFPAPPGVDGAVIHLMFVVNHHGRTIHTVVASLTPPSNQPPILGVSIHSDGWKIEPAGDDGQW